MFWQSYGVFQSDEIISQKIYQKNPWNCFFIIFFFSNSNPEFILRRYHLTTIWYLHFPTHTSFAFPKKKQHRMNVFSLLVLLAHMCSQIREIYYKLIFPKNLLHKLKICLVLFLIRRLAAKHYVEPKSIVQTLKIVTDGPLYGHTVSISKLE